MNSPVTQIKERLSIEEVVSSYIKLEKAGANLKARCPFHNEKTPSFFVSPERGSFYCFGCGAKGDIFTFIQEFEGLDFKGALKILADKAGVSLTPYNKEKEGEKDKLYRVMEEATKFFEKNLKGQKNAIEYLRRRGLKEKTMTDFRIGFVKNDWRNLYEHLHGKNFSDMEMEKAGLIKKTEKGVYDRFRGRIMFPISDSSGRIIAFSGRILEEDGKSAKYLNSPETPIFNKSSVLYGLYQAKDSIKKNGFSILVEGQMDLILSHQSGFKNTVATSGTALTDSTFSKENVISNLGLLRRLSKNIVLAFDGDKAGFSASMRAGKIALSLGMDIKVANLPGGIDPADLVLKSGPDAWRKAIRESIHIIEFVLNKVLDEYKEDTHKAGREIREKVLPFVDALDSSIEKASFIKKISDSSGIKEEALNEDLKKVSSESKVEKEEILKAENKSGALFRKDYIERRLLGIIFWQRSNPKKVLDSEKVLKNISNFLGCSEKDFLAKGEKEKEDLIFEAEVFYGTDVNLKKDTEELLKNFQEESLKEKLLKKMRELQDSETNKSQINPNAILSEINDLNKKIQDIKSGRSPFDTD